MNYIWHVILQESLHIPLNKPNAEGKTKKERIGKTISPHKGMVLIEKRIHNYVFTSHYKKCRSGWNITHTSRIRSKRK